MRRRILDKLNFGVTITNNRQLRRLNKQHRGLDHPTDVLSFEIKEKLPKGEWVGEIAVSKSYARKQAKEFGHSYEEEVAFLVAHGVLHLMGVHHASDEC